MADVNIEIRENGPLRFVGPITITDKDGNNYTVPDGEAVALCRCGHSTNKPFCSGTHREAGFEAHRTLEEGIEELLKGYRMMGRAHFGNV